jgi:hypothetical protein
MSENKYTEVEGIDASTYAGKAALAVKKKARGILGDELVIFTLVKFVQFMQLITSLMHLVYKLPKTIKKNVIFKLLKWKSQN